MDDPSLTEPATPGLRRIEDPAPAGLSLSDPDAWKTHFIRPEVRSKEWDLMIDEPLPDVFLFNFLTEQCCKLIVEAAEAANAWTTKRHDRYPATDMLISAIGIQEVYHAMLTEYIFPLAHYKWQNDGTPRWRVSENFIIKYTPDAQGHLSLHHDFSSITLNVLLNTEFAGGGTFFSKQKVLLKPKERGAAFLHPGPLTHRHGSRPVITGTRYVLVSFCR